MAVISALEDKPPTDANVKQTFEAIREAVIAEGMDLGNVASSRGSQKSQTTKASLRELFTGGRGQNFRRVILGVTIQCFQQVFTPTSVVGHLLMNPLKITGINIITYYAVRLSIFFRLGDQC